MHAKWYKMELWQASIWLRYYRLAGTARIFRRKRFQASSAAAFCRNCCPLVNVCLLTLRWERLWLQYRYESRNLAPHLLHPRPSPRRLGEHRFLDIRFPKRSGEGIWFSSVFHEILPEMPQPSTSAKYLYLYIYAWFVFKRFKSWLWVRDPLSRFKKSF